MFRFNRHLKTLLAVALAGVFFMSAAMPALADELEDKQAELEQVQRQMEQQQSKINAAQQKVSSISEQLRLIQGDLDTAQAEYKQVQQQLAQTEQQMKDNEQILSLTEKNLSHRSQVLNKRVRDIYENGQVSYVDVLLGASDFNDFATRVEILKRILRQDIALFTQVKSERDLILQKKTELEQNRLAILQLKQTAEVKKKVVEDRKKEREKILNAAVSERDKAEQAYQELQSTSQQIANMIRRIQGGSNHSGVGGSGTMIWPTSGPITSPFGWRTHPIFGTARYHSGYDIGADYGDSVVAADSGVVIYADWMGGYGKAVIIDHGNGISTLYGHNSELVVSEGQSVHKGQLIAYVGSTGYSTGPHCHFEVRQDGNPVDPGGYLP